MTDVLVGYDHIGADFISSLHGESSAIERCDEFIAAPSLRPSVNRENINPQFVVLKKLCDRAELLWPFVEKRNRGIGRRPAVRCQLALLSRYVKKRRRLSLHMTGIAGFLVTGVIGMRRLFREGRLLQLVGDHEGTQELVVV